MQDAAQERAQQRLTQLECEVVKEVVLVTRSHFPGLVMQCSMADAFLAGIAGRQINGFIGRGFSVGDADMWIENPTELQGYYIGGVKLEFKGRNGKLARSQQLWADTNMVLRRRFAVIKTVEEFFDVLVEHYGLEALMRFKQPLRNADGILAPHLCNSQGGYFCKPQFYQEHASLCRALKIADPMVRRPRKSPARPPASPPGTAATGRKRAASAERAAEGSAAAAPASPARKPVNVSRVKAITSKYAAGDWEECDVIE